MNAFRKARKFLAGGGVFFLAMFLLVACPDGNNGGGGDEPGAATGELAIEGSQFKLTWAAVPDADAYHIYHGGSRLSTSAFVTAVTEPTHTVTPKNANKYENYYRVEAQDKNKKPLATIIISLEMNKFGPNVKIYDAKYDKIAEIEKEINRIHDFEMFGSVPQGDNRRGEFSSKRYTLFFKPGTYDRHGQFKIGFNTHIAGLGALPTGTTLQGTITTPPHLTTPLNNATCTFWRSIENFQLNGSGGAMLQWGVSQSCPIRRMLVNIPTTYHYNGGWASGGFTADTKFTKDVDGGSQQQWYTRNAELASMLTGVGWNKVIQGSTGASNATQPSYTRIDNSPLIREKPFVFIDSEGEYKVFLPGIRTDAVGVSWGEGKANNGMGVGTILDLFNDFYIARADKDTADTINKQLNDGKHIYFTPGRYECSVPIRITQANTIVLGHGFPTLYPTNDKGALFIDDVDNVTVAGLMFDATNSNSTYLLAAGDMSASGNGAHASNDARTLLADLCLRIGGYYPGPVHTDIAALINSDNIIGDHFWVWRADHGVGADIGWDRNTSRNGVVVRGNDVTIYGLFVEHFHEYNTLWLGERGRVFFYQNELPYDPPTQLDYKSHGGKVDGWSAFKVANTVSEFQGTGMGMYCVFLSGVIEGIQHTREPIYLENAMEIPHKAGVQIRNATTVFIGSDGNGGIRRIINGTGQTVQNGWTNEDEGVDGNAYIRTFNTPEVGKAVLNPGVPQNVPREGTAPEDEEHLTWLTKPLI